MKSAFLSLLLLLTVTQFAHGAINDNPLTGQLSLQPKLNQTFMPINLNQNNSKDDEDDAPLVPTY